MPNGNIRSYGRLSNHQCLDGKHCLLCRGEDCQYNIIVEKRLVCYHTTGPEGYYIRKWQVDHQDMCANPGDLCSFQAFRNGTVLRGCANSKTTDRTIQLCSTNLCNRQIAGIYCFTCQPTDPNCVFSQHDGPIELCPPIHLGCFTRILKDSSVQRGCARTAFDNSTLESTYIFCNSSNLCNGKTTKSHSCNLLQLNVAFRPHTPVPDEYWLKPTDDGWMFEACEDVDGLPACYMKYDQKLLEYGCTKDLSYYGLVKYTRGAIVADLNFCDGHYCNALPDAKSPRQRKGQD